MELCAVVLAAGEGKRMRSKKAKVVHRIAGRSLVGWVRKTLNDVGAQEQVYVVGYLQEQVRAELGEDVAFVIQEQQLGTGHAVMQAAPFLESRSGCTVILSGDAPLITAETLKEAIRLFEEDGYAAIVISADAEDPTGYGRIVRNGDGDVQAIVEHKDATPEQRAIREINAGMYCFSTPKLLSALGRISSANAQNEYYLTDTVSILIGDGHRVGAMKAPLEETVGINDRAQLAQAARIMNRRIATRHMAAGVSLLDPENTWIEDTVRIGMDTEIGPCVHLQGNTEIGEDCRIGPGTHLVDARLGDRVRVEQSYIEGSLLRKGVRVGPFARILPESEIGKNSRIGAFVEMDHATVGAYTSMPQSVFLGDARVGSGVTFGAGSVTANDDGTGRSETVIGDNAFIGSNVSLVAPLRVEGNAYIAAGSVITDDVPAYALALGRERQTIKENWTRNNRNLRTAGVPPLPDEDGKSD